jgi:hypothetical protein
MATVKNREVIFELEAECGEEIVSVYDSLTKYNVDGKKAFCMFNGKKLLSSDSLDEMYIKVTGLSKLARKEKQEKAYIDIRLDSTNKYLERGYELLRKDMLSEWPKAVEIRLNDIYNGMELGCLLDISELLNEENYSAAKELFESQNHSGMSGALVLSLIHDFSNNGEIFTAIMKQKN